MTVISISPKDSVSSPRPVQPTESAPRITPEPVESMRPDWLATLARIPGDGLKGDGFPRNVLGTIMHNPDTFGPFLEYWVTCKERMSLSVREQEIVILRMAVLHASDYVWKHHVPVGREFGIDETEFTAIRAGDVEGFASSREQALFALVDELVEHRTIRRAVWDRHATALETVAIVDLIALVSQYVLFALMNNAFQVAIEPTLAEVPSLRD
ncbi:MAG: hypothetical protein RLZZ461_973 [Planctomycetota bacterium]|jgi:alkylhydroperoxidase family enzyme